MNVLRKQVVVIGGGFSGSVVAAQLLRQAPQLSIAVIDQGPAPGRGLAYGTQHDCHLLNVPAANMSAFPDEPDHFFNWARNNSALPVEPASFLPRALYGRYLAALLDEAHERCAGNFSWVRDEAVSLTPQSLGYAIRTRSGATVLADFVVLALGNFPPASLNIPGLDEKAVRYYSSAWDESTLEGLHQTDDLLLVGSGLTAVDMAVALEARGHQGKIHLLSRHGLLPQSHRQYSACAPFWNERSPRTIHGILRLLRFQARTAKSSGSDWRAAVDSLRPHIQKIWQSLPVRERRRFLRHLRPYWEVHRHRIAPEIAATFACLLISGQAELHAGRLMAYSENALGAQVAFRCRHTGITQRLCVVRVINCAGPETNCQKVASPLLASLFVEGLARQDALSLGLDTDTRGALIDVRGRASFSFFAIGPARKGNLWESTAVPELRVQAAEVAKQVLRAATNQPSGTRQMELAATR